MEKHVHLINETTARIELTQGYWALVDRDSLWLLLPYRWCVHKTKGKLYARTQEDGHAIYMHRLLMKELKNSDLVVDHRNGDGLDNRKENLRLATRQENARNSPGATKHRVSSARGVLKREHPTHP
jgi:HNH endonuclease